MILNRKSLCLTRIWIEWVNLRKTLWLMSISYSTTWKITFCILSINERTSICILWFPFGCRRASFVKASCSTSALSLIRSACSRINVKRFEIPLNRVKSIITILQLLKIQIYRVMFEQLSWFLPILIMTTKAIHFIFQLFCVKSCDLTSLPEAWSNEAVSRCSFTKFKINFLAI